MKLSIVIINRDQCRMLRYGLLALQLDEHATDAEVIVIDDASADNSVNMVRTEFPLVKVLANQKQLDFSASANQAITAARGEYILLMHSHVLTSPDAIKKVMAFMDGHANAGSVSVRMIDELGNFMPESKKGMPAGWVSFFKFTGLTRMFSKSRLFNHYYKDGWIDEFETSETDVLNNCFALLRRSVLTQVGLFDERFPVFGQDIDLSCRINHAGFKNYYFAQTFVIQQHIKPISKWSWYYIRNFYGAMLMFAVKYLFKLPEVPLSGSLGWPTPTYEFKQ